MSSMTLIDVRDWHRKCATICRRTNEPALANLHDNMADAIDAYLLSQDAEIERLQSRLAAADERLETTERTLERCKQTLDTTSECWRLDSERLEAADKLLRDIASCQWFNREAPATVELIDAHLQADAATQEGEG